MPRPKGSVGDHMFPKPTSKRPEMFEPNARDNPDSLTPNNPFKKTVGSGGMPKGPFGKKGHGF